MDKDLSVADAMALQRGGDMDGFGGGSWWIILIVLFLFGFNGNGLGGNNATTNQLNSDFITRDLFAINQNISAQGCETRETVLQNRFDTQLGFQNLGSQMASCCCETNRNIDAVRYENAKNTCDIITNANANTQRLIDHMTTQEIQALRDQLQSAQLTLAQGAQTDALITALRPTPQPAWITCSPYTALNGGCGGCGSLI